MRSNLNFLRARLGVMWVWIHVSFRYGYEFCESFQFFFECWKIAPILKKINLLVVVELHKKCK